MHMSQTQPEIAGIVIAFAPHAARSPAAAQGMCLTPLDRIVVTTWQDRARLVGFDRMVIHDRDPGDATEVGNFLSVYRSGQAWSRWGFARHGHVVRAWCCLTLADVGEFSCMAEALEDVLEGMAQVATRGRARRVGSAA